MPQTATFTLYSGIAGTGKTTTLLSLYRDALQQARDAGTPGTTLWLAPTNRAQAQIRQRLLNSSLDIVFRPNLLTFDQFADEILKGAPDQVWPCSATIQRVLLRRVVAQLVREKRVRHFRQIARTAGFLDLVSAFIAELKRNETWPERFAEACAKRGNRVADVELELIYERYQAALLSANLYDSEGRFWSARKTLESGAWGKFADVTTVVIDGFTDFTEAQFRILQLLSHRVQTIYISLQLEVTEQRQDLFAKTMDVRKRLQALGQIQEQMFPAALTATAPAAAKRTRQRAGANPPNTQASAAVLPAGIAQVIQHLFTNPREITKSDDATGIEVFAIAGRLGEVRFLASRIKQLLLQGVAPTDIVVAIRDLDDYAALVDEIFTAAGIPFACEAGLAASRLPTVKALCNLLSLEVEDWPFARLLGVLDSNYFRPAWKELEGGRAIRDVSALLRRYQLSEGREDILATLASRAATEADGTNAQAAARRAWLLLNRLSAALADLRGERDLAGWAPIIQRLVQEFGLAVVPLDESSKKQQRTFGDFLASVLSEVSLLDAWPSMESQPLGLVDFLGELTDLLDLHPLPPRTPEDGRVRVLSAEQVRNLDIPHLFVAGLTETAFPRHRSDDCLYGERDRQELNEQGLSLGHRTQRSQEELLMFFGVVTRARQQLILTYPAVSDEGQPLTCSPYLTSICDLFNETALRAQLDERLNPIPEPDRTLSAADCRVLGMATALAGEAGLYRAVCDSQPEARHALAAVDMNVKRFHSRGFTDCEGRLTNPHNIDRIQKRFSADHQFSATQLEGYAECPFKFLVSQILQIKPPVLPGIETDFAGRGSLVHELLAELHRSLSASHRDPANPIPTGEIVTAEFRRLLNERCRVRAETGTVHRTLERIEHRILSEWAVEYGLQWDNYVRTLPTPAARPLQPALFEAVFGSARQAPAGIPSQSPSEVDSASGAGETTATYGPLILGKPDEAIRVGGRIDRIDVGEVDGQQVFTVIDYKTGKPASKSLNNVETGRALQLALYTLAVARLQMAGPQAEPWQLGYWYLKEQGFASPMSGKKGPDDVLPRIDPSDWKKLAVTLESQVVQLAAGIRAGSFPPHNRDKHCTSGCDYNTICRVAQLRPLAESLQKFPGTDRPAPGDDPLTD
ncbi:MAG: exodeoxyribonuclease V subunit gamma [Planctomycetes bacterium]|nr:exodeoxyribonuclease V subunit gamma [Planctomycetota bacterium]